MLNTKIFPLEAKMTEQDNYDLTQLAILEYLTTGVTSVFDMYLSPKGYRPGMCGYGNALCAGKRPEQIRPGA